MFQRNDHVVGEDLLLLSAVDEADAYTAVGVELMHVLRFVCVNVIAIRKICKKHDRLLANRMLGGYYHRKHRQRGCDGDFVGLSVHMGTSRKERSAKRQGSPPTNMTDRRSPALGEMLSSRIAEAEKREAGMPQNVYKLVGSYDARVQSLANSTTVQTVSSSLALALSEYEVSQNRADALARLNTTSTAATPVRGGRDKGSPTDTAVGPAGGVSGFFSHQSAPARAYRLSPSRWVDGWDACRSPPPTDLPRGSKGWFGGAVSSPPSCDDTGAPPPSTELTRLKFAVASVFALREAARTKPAPFGTYLSRLSMAYTGPNVVGEGMDGSSRETLDFFVMYNPDMALLLDPRVLHNCLRIGGKHRETTLCSIMISSLVVASAASLPSMLSTSLENDQYCHNGEGIDKSLVQNALSIAPRCCNLDEYGQVAMSEHSPAEASGSSGNYINLATVRLNRASVFLYTVNYYIIVPTANSFIVLVGARPAHSAMLIGAASVSAIVSALYHTFLLSTNSSTIKLINGHSVFRAPLLFSSVCAMIGNVVYAKATTHNSMAMAVGGRLLIGLGSSEILNRQLITNCIPPVRLVPEAAKFVSLSMVGTCIGSLFGALMGSVYARKERIVVGGDQIFVDSLAAPGYLMAILWLLQLLGLFFFFEEPMEARANDSEQHSPAKDDGNSNITSVNEIRDTLPSDGVAEEGDSEVSDGGGTPDSVFYRSSSDVTKEDLNTTYGTSALAHLSEDEKALPKTKTDHSNGAAQLAFTQVSTKKDRRARSLAMASYHIKKIITQNVAIAVTLAVLAFAKLAQEILFSACAIIAHRYFSWDGARAGFMLAALAALLIPLNFIFSNVSKYHDERTVMKRSLQIVGLGLIVMLNVEGLLLLARHKGDLFRESKIPNTSHTHPYDWFLGLYQFVLGFVVTFCGSAVLEGVTLSLMSKVAHPKLNATAINCGSIITFITLFSKVVGDVHILAVGLSHRIINTDIVNSLVFPLICACGAAYYVVKRHFFFLF